MPWKMYHCSKCGNWQSAKNGKYCLNCNSEMEATEYIDESFPPTEDFLLDSNLRFDIKKGILETETTQQEKMPNRLEETNQTQKDIELDNFTTNIVSQKDINRLFREISGMSEDIRFIATVLKVFVAINIISFLICFFAILLSLN
ncbi:MAG: hypothetical protein K6G30_13440 [Acetatifactor sp.]|nr:hypothetical protein [Acetatifactor sp.]